MERLVVDGGRRFVGGQLRGEVELGGGVSLVSAGAMRPFVLALDPDGHALGARSSELAGPPVGVRDGQAITLAASAAGARLRSWLLDPGTSPLGFSLVFSGLNGELAPIAGEARGRRIAASGDDAVRVDGLEVNGRAGLPQVFEIGL